MTSASSSPSHSFFSLVSQPPKHLIAPHYSLVQYTLALVCSGVSAHRIWGDPGYVVGEMGCTVKMERGPVPAPWPNVGAAPFIPAHCGFVFSALARLEQVYS